MQSRRDFCNCAVLGGVAALASTPALAATVVDVCKPFTADDQKAISPDDAIAALKAGNDRYIAGKSLNCDLPAGIAATAKTQSPFACVLGCIDSRVAPELVFDQKVGGIFVARVAGNVANVDNIGSFEFATKVAGAKAIVVLGHSSCGAVKGAIGRAKVGDNLTALLSEIEPAIAATPFTGERTSENDAFVESVIESNVRANMRKLTGNSPVIKALVDAGTVKIAGAICDLNSGRVTFLS